MEAREEGNGDEDDDCFFAVADFDLCVWIGGLACLPYILRIINFRNGPVVARALTP